jgi:maltooligosyltrehalose trehalohydrolase
MLFQGQEFLSSSPFLYFTDHSAELGRLVTEGRRREFGRFAAFTDPAVRARIPDPQDPATFERSKLRLDEAAYGLGALCHDLHAELLRIRAADPALREARRGRPPLRTTAVDRALLVEFGSGAHRRAVAANFGTAATVLPLGNPARLSIRLHSGEPRFGGNAVAPSLSGAGLALPAHSAAFLAPAAG